MPGLTLTARTNRPLLQEVFDDMKRKVCTGRITEPEEVAAAIVFLGSAANGHINGEMIRVDGGM
jgi:3-oxoacyl-[acyl-carrier protein] reductase